MQEATSTSHMCVCQAILFGSFHWRAAKAVADFERALAEEGAQLSAHGTNNTQGAQRVNQWHNLTAAVPRPVKEAVCSLCDG